MITATGTHRSGSVCLVKFTEWKDQFLGITSTLVEIQIQNSKGKTYSYRYDVDQALSRVAEQRIAAAKHSGPKVVWMSLFGTPNKSGHRGLVPWLRTQADKGTGNVIRL